MSELKGTPGPWIVLVGHDGISRIMANCPLVANAKGFTEEVATLCDHDDGPLIAAAPAYHAAVEALLDALDHGSDRDMDAAWIALDVVHAAAKGGG